MILKMRKFLYGLPGGLRKYVICSLALLLLFYSVVAQKRPKPRIPAALKKFTARITYEILRNDSNKNLLFSPLPIQVYLTLLSFGASNETRQEMLQSLNFGQLSHEKVLKYFDRFMQHLPSYASREFDVIMNTQIIGQEFKQSFKTIANQNFQTSIDEIENIDLSRLNRYVAQQTNQKIKKFIINKDLPHFTYAVLLNCLYMEGGFVHKFNESLTKERHFYNYGIYTENKKVDMMHMWAKLNYTKIPEFDATGVILPYQGERVKLLVMLPNKRDGLKKMEESFATMKNVHLFTLPLEEKNVEIMLPKFSIQYNIKLREIMTRIGMHTPFTKNATFTNIFEEAIFSKFGQMKQISYFDVSESGSGVTSSLFVSMVKRQRRSSTYHVENDKPNNAKVHQSIKFIVDHPFSFYIYTDRNLYFIGHITNVPLF